MRHFNNNKRTYLRPRTLPVFPGFISFQPGVTDFLLQSSVKKQRPGFEPATSVLDSNIKLRSKVCGIIYFLKNIKIINTNLKIK